MTPNERFAKAAGICWHEQKDSQTLECKHCGEGMLFPWQRNPDFTDAREVLKVVRMWPLKQYAAFLNSGVGCYDFAEPAAGIPNATEMIEVEYILDRTGKLRDAAITWMEGRKG